MKFCRFKKSTTQSPFIYTGKVLIDLNDLTVFHPANDNRIKLVKDERSFKDSMWHVKPIAMTKKQIFVVCPICGEIHVHGMANGSYEGSRTPHCKNFEVHENYYIERE